ncbi:SAVED domain-containing protein [Phorcysia thermohydrogeniphila]|uniref:SMODS-associated and fused to various effectors domain-containing protein n=1 Tax=Phorcysia thermohydrogeniphila TaxID=936138 RepID=A0A4R1GDP6_9BACT|nr:SAVED domain-containing protein [Phorcysia thermohydrogeniphila]TCK06214.1 hypothetical protein CLV27_0015 [Phorcysia thermohydrogeniphila]
MSYLLRLLEKEKFSTVLSYLEGWKRGEVELEKEEIATAVKCKRPEVSFKAVEGLFERFSFEEVKEIFKELFNITPLSPPVKFSFPAINEKEGVLIKALAFLSDKTFSPKEELSQVKEVTQKEFGFFYNREFSGESFQAPLAYALLYGELPKRVILSGKLLPKGNFKAENAKEKEEVATKEGKFLIAEGNIHEIKEFFSKEEKDIPLLIATGKREENIPNFEIFCKNVGFKPLKGLLDEEKLIVELPTFLPHDRDWRELFLPIREKVLKLKEFLPDLSLHVALKAPITFSLGAGAVIGTGKVPVAVYHFENGSYHRVIDLRKDSRRIKRRKRKLSFIEVEEEVRGSDTAVIALQVASHETRSKGEELSQKFNADFFYVNAPELKGSLPLDLDWAEVVAEIYEAFNRIYAKGHKKFHLVMSVPNPIAFALGMAVGNYWDVTVWSYFKPLKDYRPVYNLGEVENV